jgi:hypothetical protein
VGPTRQRVREGEGERREREAAERAGWAKTDGPRVGLAGRLGLFFFIFFIFFFSIPFSNLLISKLFHLFKLKF